MDDLAEYNPYDKSLYPKHHNIARLLLTGKSVRYSTLYDKTGLSPRTLSTVLKHLDECGIVVKRLKDEDRQVVYRASKGRKALLKKNLDPLAH